MKNVLLLILGALFLVAMLGLSSFVSAAPPAQGSTTPVAGGDDATGIDATGADTSAIPAAPTNPGTMVSRILVFNPDTTTPFATVRVRIIDTSGNTVATLPDFTVPIDGVVAKSLPSTIASPFSGSAVVSSDKNVQALVTNSNSNQVARDEYAGTLAPAPLLTLPLVRHLAADTGNSIIAVQNTGASPTTIVLNLYDAGGNLLPAQPGITSVANVAPLASAYFNTNAIFPSGQFTGSASVTGGGTIALAAAEQNRLKKDTVSFRGLTLGDQGTTLYVPLAERVANTTGVIVNWNELYIRNEGGSSTTVKAEYVNPVGVTKYVTQTLTSIPSNGMAILNTRDAGFQALKLNFKGWVKLTSMSGQPITAYALESWNNARLFGSEAVPTAQLATVAVCGDVFKTSTQTSKITVLNTGATTATVAIKLYSPTTAKAVGVKSVSIAPNGTVSVASTDAAFAGAGTAFDGLALVTSKTGQPLVASVYTPYVYSGVPGGVTAYTCSKLQ